MNEKIIISLTTIPSRLSADDDKGIKSCLNSLIDQNHQNFEIHLNIPHFYKKTNTEYIIPNWISDYEKTEKFKFFRTEDYGSATKIIPTLHRIKNPESIIVVVDDDIVYHKEMLSEQQKNRKKWSEYIVGYDGLRSRKTDGSLSNFFGDPRDYYYTAVKKNSLVDIVQHWSSVSYMRSFFEDDFFDFWSQNQTWCDDRTLAAYFSFKKRGRLVTYYEKDDYIFEDNFWKLNQSFQFPILGHTNHEQKEGCNLNRMNVNVEEEKKINNLYVNYIDKGYSGKTWEI